MELIKENINYNFLNYNNNLTENLIYINKKNVNWDIILLENTNISDEFILKNLYRLKKIEDISLNSSFPFNVYNFFKNNRNNLDNKKKLLSFKFFRNLRKYYKYKKVSYNNVINKIKLQTLKNNIYNLNWSLISEYYNISNEFILDEFNKINWKAFSRNSSLNSKFISRYKNYIDFNELSDNLFYYDKDRYDKYVIKIQKKYRYLKYKFTN